MNTDQLSDLFTRIRNAQAIGLSEALVGHSKIKMEIAQLMVKHRFLTEAVQESDKGHKNIRLVLAYQNGRPVIHEIVRISKPGQRIYLPAKEIKPVKRGRGMLIISTSKGLISGQEAWKQKVGGELIAKIW